MKTQSCIFFCVMTLLCGGEIAAQAPKISNVSPLPHEIQAAADAEIIISFDSPVDTSSINGATLRVFGRWSGPAKGGLSFSNENKEVRFQPDEPFFAGELVAVQLSKNVKSIAGENMLKPYAWNYWIAASPGTLQQTLIETIELRLPGETHIQTYGAYAGDINDDGYSDLVAVNEASDDLRILLNDGNGLYPYFSVYDTGNNKTPSPSEGGDFNNDGKLDMVVTTAWDNEVRILFGDGQGHFTSMDTYYLTEGNGVRGVGVGDFNGDGWDDIFSTNRLSGNISILINDGDGTFTTSYMNLPNQDEAVCAVADINNDGVLDAFFGSYNSQKIGVLLGNGNGEFTLAGSVFVQGRPWMLGAGDLNGDGNADVVSVNSNGHRTAVIFGDGQGGLGQPVHYAPENHTFPLAVDLGDIDGDGDLDVVTSNYASKTYTVFENNGTGQFTVAKVLAAPKAASCAILHDRDNDGDLDITAIDEEADVILLFDNSGPIINSAGDKTNNEYNFALYPSLAREKVFIEFQLPESEPVLISIFDAAGSLVRREQKSVYSAGTHLYVWDIPFGINTGLYLVQLQIANNTVVGKINIIK